MTLSERILIPFEGGFAEVESEKLEPGDKVDGIPMPDGEYYDIKLKSVDDGEQAILITKSDGTEVALKCLNIFRIATTSGKLQH